MKKSVFDEYAEIAEEQGLIKTAEYSKSRVGNDDISTIELLYGVKPNEKDEKDMIDQGHQETAVVAPAHDKMNAVVENEKQRQDISSYIANRNPDGNLVQRKYVSAYQDLMDGLVATSFRMEANEEEELMKLSDLCANQLEKKAIGPLLPIAGGIAGVLGIIAYINNSSNSLQNVVNNAESVIRELKDLSEELPSDFYRALMSQLRHLQKEAAEFHSLQGKIYVKNVKDLVEASHNNQQDLEKAKEFKKLSEKMKELIPTYINDIKNMAQQSYTWDWAQKIMDAVHLLIPSDVEDVVNALMGLEKALEHEINFANYLLSKAEENEPKLQEKLEEEQKKAEEEAEGFYSDVLSD